MKSDETLLIEGPYFEDLVLGTIPETPPSITVTDSFTALHQMLFGDRLRLPLDHHLSTKITGSDNGLVHPSITINLAIGQTTYVTQRVIGNLFYKGLVLKQPVFISDSLTTLTKIIALRQNSAKAGRVASGLALLETNVINQHGEEILNFWRCPMIPCRNNEVNTEKNDNLDIIADEISFTLLQKAVPQNWDLNLYRQKFTGIHFNEIELGVNYQLEARDTITCASELARLTLNMAMAHTDEKASIHGERLVYGGHTISMAAAQMVRVFPNVVTHIAWRYCDHTAPVFENDILRSEILIENKTALEPEGGLVDMRIKVWASRAENRSEEEQEVQVLDWGLVVLMA